jgi:hypothetical protein
VAEARADLRLQLVQLVGNLARIFAFAGQADVNLAAANTLMVGFRIA